MSRVLDIGPLRSFVAVADCGGFLRAASVLHLSQAAVSQHVRRLESAVGRTLVERDGRGSRMTADGERLLGEARRLLAAHDSILHSFGAGTPKTLVVGSTEHAAAQLLPPLAAELERTLPDHAVRLRIDRGTRLREGLKSRSIDVALLLGPATAPQAIPVGDLELTWFSGPGWKRPGAGRPLPLAAFDDPCALRTRALETLAQRDIPAVIAAEAAQLAGVQAAVAAGVGVALMATLGQTPEGLVARNDLPPAAPLELGVWSRSGLPAETAHSVADALRGVIDTQRYGVAEGLQLLKGA